VTSTAETNLRHIADNWNTLRELLEAGTPRTWPPAMGLQHLDQDDDALTAYHQAAAQERAERTALAPGQRPAPLRVSVLDVLTELEDELLALADEIAGAVQRPAFTTAIRSAAPHDDVARSLALMGLKDQQDSRRWRFNMAHRDGQTAAAWLADRVDGAAGPFRPLSEAQRRRITAVAASVRHRLDRAIGYDETEDGAEPTATRLVVTCGCGEALEMLTSSTAPVIRCTGCGDSATFHGISGLEAA
jgi:hypothetical protein